jgi:thiol-disulfide isomerase/thioredoxin
MRYLIMLHILINFFAARAQFTQHVFTDLQSDYVNIKPGSKATVIVMLSPECPLCQSYSRTLNQLQATYAKKGVLFYGVVPGNSFTPLEVEAYAKKYQIGFTLLFDHNMKFTRAVKATKTPEVLVYDHTFALRYMGRIDNWAIALGKKRTVITDHNLRDAIEAILLNKPISITKTEAIGCYIED